MNLKKCLFVSGFASIAIGGGMFGAGVSTASADESREGMEVMTRGPVHEAFAETVVFDPLPGIIVTRQPPALIEEIMPEQRPSGDNVAWIPGYWAWDEERNDFLWVSGIWRNLPPGREWVPGYWSTVDTGHQWTSGYWQDAETSEVTYLPEPPRSVEAGPNIEASSDDQTWIPGSWEYRENRYAWRAGIWVTARPNWCWVPSYYRWAPRGYVYVDGYWDYPVVSRGVVFAPVRFTRAYCERPDFYYSPLTVISLSVFSNHLFLRPNYCHYYFGDYYEPIYRDRYYASCSYGSRYRGYDPIYAHYRWENRHDRTWDRQRQDYYEYRRDNVDARPPRTWSELNDRRARDGDRSDYAVAERYDRVTDSRKDGRSGYQKVSSDERQRFVSQKNEIRNYSRERQQREVTDGRTRDDQQGRTQVSREKVSRSPLVGNRSDRTEKNGGPPERLQKRTSDKSDLATRDSQKGNASQGERQESPRTEAKRDASGIAQNKAEPSRESRTMPGQRRDPVTSSNTKTQQATDTRGKSNTVAGSGREMERQTRTESTSKGNVEPKPNVDPGSRSVDKTKTEKRTEIPNVQRREQATPQPELKKPSRQEAPSQKALPAPTRESTQRSLPQRVLPGPQQQAQPQRTLSPRPEQRQVQPAPQRQQALPQRVQPRPQQVVPQRQQIERAPQRQQMERAPERIQSRPQQSIPQRQMERPTSQSRQESSRPQTESRSSSSVETSEERRSDGKRR